jgi:hypothetical protein
MYAKDAGDIWLNEINPGLQVEGAVYFDVPKDFIADHVELHDSAFSGGVSVNLR